MSQDAQAYAILDSLLAQPFTQPWPGILEQLGYTPTAARIVFNKWARDRGRRQREQHNRITMEQLFKPKLD